MKFPSIFRHIKFDLNQNNLVEAVVEVEVVENCSLVLHRIQVLADYKLPDHHYNLYNADYRSNTKYHPLCRYYKSHQREEVGGRMNCKQNRHNREGKLRDSLYILFLG